MIDDKIIDALRQADLLLGEYIKLLSPIAKKLADMKSKLVFGKKGYYAGGLGCYEDGIDNLCLLLRDKGYPKKGFPGKTHWEKAYAAQEKIFAEIRSKIILCNINLSGHF